MKLVETVEKILHSERLKIDMERKDIQIQRAQMAVLRKE
jgi:hypothetical protein